MDTPPEVCMERIKERAKDKSFDRFETLEKLKRAREGYLLFMDKIPGVITRVDGNRSIDAITQEIVSVIERNPKRQSSI